MDNRDKSGIRTLAAESPRKDEEKTIYLINPDYLAPTFGYYFAKSPVQFYGFARWERPEIFSPQGYAELWNSPTLISDTEKRIRDEAQKGYQKLALVHENANNSGKIKYSQGQELLSRLKQTYQLLEQKDYRGKIESVTLYLFSLIDTPSDKSGDS